MSPQSKLSIIISYILWWILYKTGLQILLCYFHFISPHAMLQWVLTIKNLECVHQIQMNLYNFVILGALSVQLYKNIKILTHTSLIIHESDNIFSSLSVSQSGRKEGTISSAGGQSGGHISWAPQRFLLIYDFRHISFISPSVVFFSFRRVTQSCNGFNG